jgi:Carboxypeptidase regulatory-like domain/TonB dependent receptor/TonB-dependent Receptor Plug Domain
MNRRWLIVVAVWLLGPMWLSAQVSSTGAITGDVTDSSGASVPNAQVVITNVGTNGASNLTTNSAGIYSAPNLGPGEYSVQVSLTSFQTQTKTGLVLSIGQTITVDFTLSLGTAKESVEVVSTARQAVDTTTSMMGTEITSAAVENLPLNSRNFLDLVPLVPGAQPGSPGSGNTQTMFNIDGGRGTANGFELNGSDITPAARDSLHFTPNLEAIGEFQILTNNFSAEYGRSMGGIVNVKLKSGTNSVHGSIFEYFRNTALDASQLGSNGKQLPYIFNQFGASAGAPIIKNKLFIFGDYQGTRSLTSGTDDLNVPLAVQSQPSGGFSSGTPARPLGTYDWSALCPANGGTFVGGVCSKLAGQLFNPYVSPRVAFPNNQIPASLVDPTTALIFSLFPAPNQSCGVGNIPTCPWNYILTQANHGQADAGDLQLDYVLSPKDHLSFGMLYSNNEFACDPIFNNRNNGNQVICVGGEAARVYTVNYARVINSGMVNELNYAYTIDHSNGPKQQGNQYEPSIAGLGGLNTNPNDPLTTGFPLILISSNFALTNAGAGAGGPSFQHNNIPQIADNFSFIKGRHSFKTGFIAHLREFNLEQTTFPRGAYIFNNFPSSSGAGQPGIPMFSGGDAFASALLGVPLVAMRSILTFGEYGERDHEYGAYFQDAFKLKPRLTLNLGIRWDLYEPATESHNHLANFNPATVMMILPGNGVSASTLSTNWHDFSPHVGFAYALTNDRKTSLRAGYGIAYLQQVTQAAGTATDRLMQNSPFIFNIGGQTLIQDALGIPIETVSQGLPLVNPSNPTIPPSGTTIVYIPKSQPTSYVQQ